MFIGKITHIDQGMDTGERLHLVKYADGDFEHLTKEDVVQSADLAENERKAHAADNPSIDHARRQGSISAISPSAKPRPGEGLDGDLGVGARRAEMHRQWAKGHVDIWLLPNDHMHIVTRIPHR